MNRGQEALQMFVAFSPSGSQDELRRIPDFKLILPGD